MIPRPHHHLNHFECPPQLRPNTCGLVSSPSTSSGLNGSLLVVSRKRLFLFCLDTCSPTSLSPRMLLYNSITHWWPSPLTSSNSRPLSYKYATSVDQENQLHFWIFFSRRSFFEISSCASSSRRMSAVVQTEVLPLVLDSSSPQPPLFDGKTRLYISYICPYAQRPWIVRNYKGLQEKIELVPLDLGNKPDWYKEKVYAGNKVPALEHNKEVKGESLDLIKYIDGHFDGPSLLPDDAEKKSFAEELLSYSDSFNMTNYTAFKSKEDPETEVGAAYDKLEDALSKFDGPFFLGEFSLVDVAYVPFVERFQYFLSQVKNYDITKGRPKLASWIEELNKLEAYKQTCQDPEELLVLIKKRLGIE